MLLDNFFFDDANFFDEIWETNLGWISEILTQLIFNLFQQLMHPAEAQSSFNLADISDVAFNDRFSKKICNFFCCIHSNKWISVSITTWPESKSKESMIISEFISNNFAQPILQLSHTIIEDIL